MIFKNKNIHKYVSVDRVSIDSDNGLLPIRRQAIIKNSAEILSIGSLRKKISEIQIKMQNFHENAFENIVCEIVAILSKCRWVKR